MREFTLRKKKLIDDDDDGDTVRGHKTHPHTHTGTIIGQQVYGGASVSLSLGSLSVQLHFFCGSFYAASLKPEGGI